MKHNLAAIFCIAASLFLLSLLGSCTDNPDTIAGGSTETGNAGLTGRLVYEDGRSAANVPVNIQLEIYPDTSALPSANILPSYTGKTDRDGHFTVTINDTGTYILTAAGENNSALRIESLTVMNPEAARDLGIDTLRIAGSIQGVIRLPEGGNPEKVFILSPGLNRYSLVDVQGQFTFDSLASGTYALLFFSTLDNYRNKAFFPIVVTSASVTLLDTILLEYTGIPTPQNLTAVYDTLHQIATLTWGKLDTQSVKSYIVYRKNVDSNTLFLPITTTALRDTFFTDSNMTPGTLYKYRVSAIDSFEDEGTKSTAISVFSANAYEVIDSLLLPETASRVAMSQTGVVYAVGRATRTVFAIDTQSGNVLRSWKLYNGSVQEIIYDFSVLNDSNLFFATYSNSVNHICWCDDTGGLKARYDILDADIETFGIRRMAAMDKGLLLIDGSQKNAYFFNTASYALNKILSLSQFEFEQINTDFFDGVGATDSGFVFGAANDPSNRLQTLVFTMNIDRYLPMMTSEGLAGIFGFRRGTTPTQLAWVGGNVIAANNGTLWIKLPGNSAPYKSGILKDASANLCVNSLEKIFVCSSTKPCIYVYRPVMKIPGIN